MTLNMYYHACPQLAEGRTSKDQRMPNTVKLRPSTGFRLRFTDGLRMTFVSWNHGYHFDSVEIDKKRYQGNPR